MPDILIYVEHDSGTPHRSALEAASGAAPLAADLGGKLIALAVGKGAAGTATTLGEYGVQDLYVNEDEVFDNYLSEPQIEILAKLVEEAHPQVVLLPYTQDGKDIGSGLGARLSAGMVANVVGATPDNGRVVAMETVFGGQYTTRIDIVNSPVAIFLVRANAFGLVERHQDVTT